MATSALRAATFPQLKGFNREADGEGTRGGRRGWEKLFAGFLALMFLFWDRLDDANRFPDAKLESLGVARRSPRIFVQRGRKKGGSRGFHSAYPVEKRPRGIIVPSDIQYRGKITLSFETSGTFELSEQGWAMVSWTLQLRPLSALRL